MQLRRSLLRRECHFSKELVAVTASEAFFINFKRECLLHNTTAIVSGHKIQNQMMNRKHSSGHRFRKLAQKLLQNWHYGFPAFSIVNNSEQFCSDKVYAFSTWSKYFHLALIIMGSVSWYMRFQAVMIEYQVWGRSPKGKTVFLSGWDVQNRIHSRTEKEKLNFIYNCECMFQAKLLNFIYFSASRHDTFISFYFTFFPVGFIYWHR